MSGAKQRALAICHTPYQVLVELVRALKEDMPTDFLLSAVVPDASALSGRLAAAGFSAQVFDEDACGNAIQPGLVRTLLFQKLLGRRNVEKHYGFTLCKNQYSRVYIHNDWSVLGRYLQDKNIPYILCEDTFASTCHPDHALIDRQRAQPHFRLLQKLGKGYLYWGDWKGICAVETEDLARCGLSGMPIAEHSKAALFAALTPGQKETILRVFLTDPLPQKADGAVIFMPRDFVSEHLCTEAEQAALYKAAAQRFCTGGPLFIKAHPRDKTDYSRLFPGAVILQRTMPSEVLNFCLPFRFARAVTIESTVLGSFQVADEKITLTLAQARALIEPSGR